MLNKFRGWLVVPLFLMLTGPAAADPIPPTGDLTVFCFRITHILLVQGDPEVDRFRVEFEILNWSNQAVHGVFMALNTDTMAGGDAPPLIAGAGIDPDGRPLVGPKDRPPGNQNIPNDFIVNTTLKPISQTRVQWGLGAPVPPVDIMNPTQVTSPSDPRISFMSFTNPTDPASVVVETIDDSVNVRDGFYLTIDDLDVGETVSLNWILLNGDGNPIGTVNSGNAFGFGVVNLNRILPESNPSGVGQTQRQFYSTVYRNLSENWEFTCQFIPMTTLPWWNPPDNPDIPPSVPTALTLFNARAQITPQGTQITWNGPPVSTASGFHVYAAMDGSKELIRINHRRIPSLGGEGRFRMVAPNIPVSHYVIEEIDLRGGVSGLTKVEIREEKDER